MRAFGIFFADSGQCWKIGPSAGTAAASPPMADAQSDAVTHGLNIDSKIQSLFFMRLFKTF
jgi:hypothetical protein